MRLRNSPKYYIKTTIQSHKYLDDSVYLIKTILLFTFNKFTIDRCLAKFLDIFIGENSDKYVWMHLNSFFILFFGVFEDGSTDIILNLFHLFINN